MPPSISEVARINIPEAESEKVEAKVEKSEEVGTESVESSTAKPPHASQGYEKLFNSVVHALETAHNGYHTSLTAMDLWPRVDFSGLPEDNRPNYSAFSTYVHTKARQGLLSSRVETDKERLVRLRGKPARFNRYATLFGPPGADEVKTVKRRYEEHNPLSPEQRRFLELNPTIRSRGKGDAPEKQIPVKFKRLDLDPHPEQEFDAAIAEKYEASQQQQQQQQQQVEQQEPVEEHNHPVAAMATLRNGSTNKSASTTHDLGERMNRLEAENHRLRSAMNYIARALSELTT